MSGFSYTRKNGTIVQIVSIDNHCPDYYQWGINCKNLDMTETQTQIMISNHRDNDNGFTSDQYDLFWCGYHDTKG